MRCRGNERSREGQVGCVRWKSGRLGSHTHLVRAEATGSGKRERSDGEEGLEIVCEGT